MVDVRHLPYFSLFLGGEGSFSRSFSNNLECQYCGIMDSSNKKGMTPT